MTARAKKRPLSRASKARVKAEHTLIPVGLTPPVRRVQFTQFQVVPVGPTVQIYGLGVDGLIYIFDVSNEIWLQCPLEYKTDIELLESVGTEEVGVN